ncbi:insulinase family protein [bacterium]|nr:insulinase family protein [candidate division CSSED10-310 bacterium]
MWKNFKWKLLTVLLLVLPPVSAGQSDLKQFFDRELTSRVETFTLDNGLQFLLLRQPEIPVFSAVVLVKAGGVDEPRGKSGIAHMFEHMAFKGTTSVGTVDFELEKPALERIERLGYDLTRLRKDHPENTEQIANLSAELKTAQQTHDTLIRNNEFSQIYDRSGARFMNAMTGPDQTMYIVKLPKNRLELWARMETDRLMNPVFRQFYQEREVIMEERRMGVDNSPSGQLWEEFQAAAYTAHPYGDPVIGWMSDIQGLTIEDARAFHATYYVPSNIAVAVVGDIELQELKQVALRYFGIIPAAPEPRRNIPDEPEQVTERRVKLVRDAKPALMMGWHAPKYPSDGACALEVAARVLAQGRTSRLYKRLVMDEKLASGVSVGNFNLARYPALFTVQVDPVRGEDWQRIRDAVLEEIARLSSDPPSDRELLKMKKSIVAEFLRSIERSMFLAIQLAYYEKIMGNWQIMGRYLSDIEAVTAQQVADAAATYLKPGHCTTGVLVGGEEKNR